MIPENSHSPFPGIIHSAPFSVRGFFVNDRKIAEPAPIQPSSVQLRRISRHFLPDHAMQIRHFFCHDRIAFSFPGNRFYYYKSKSK
ncbi:hypothetical protein [Burkholderia anthina]|uniref:hypothetical protein n=1 Tax=Burkholderia anthina TaxID=179879 RepID=UPI000AB0BBE7|nr:hypothetical protein [Burkholderia anthina]